MKNLRSLLHNLRPGTRNVKALTAVVCALILFSSTAVFAGWSPNRPVFDWKNPADQVGSVNGPVFNSFINTPYYGDERAFFDASSTDSPNSFKDVLPNVTVGSQEVILRTYVHNNANQSLNDAAHGFKSVAHNTQVRIALPTTTDTSLRSSSYISADNAVPTQVVDTADLTAATPFSMQYVPGSATIYNGAHSNGMPLSDNIVTTGDKIGYQNMDGEFPGCFQYQAIITIHVKIVTPTLSITKQVRQVGQKTWAKSVAVHPGDQVQYLLSVQDKGKTNLDHVLVSDQLPPHETVVPGSVHYIDAAQDVVQKDAPLFTTGGIDTGTWQPNGGFYIEFSATVNGDFDPCQISIRNIGYAKSTQTPNESNDFADVTVTRQNCNSVQPSYSCDLLNVTKVSGDTYKFTVNTTAINGAIVNRYFFNFGDNTETLTTNQNTAQHTYAQSGSYQSSVKVEFMVDGSVQTASSQACTATITIPVTTTPPTITPPPNTTLPNTGPGNIIGIFSITTIAGTVLHRLFWVKRRGL